MDALSEISICYFRYVLHLQTSSHINTETSLLQVFMCIWMHVQSALHYFIYFGPVCVRVLQLGKASEQPVTCPLLLL